MEKTPYQQPKVEKLMEYQFASSIKKVLFNKELDLMVVGFKDGTVHSFILTVEGKNMNMNEDDFEENDQLLV